MTTSRNVHLVGSFPFDSTSEVFDLCAVHLDGLLKRIPDGEPGIRKHWIAWQNFDLLVKVPDLEVGGQGRIPNIPPFPTFRPRTGLAAQDVRFPALGYARAAVESYRLFKEYQSAGKIGEGVKFQVSLPMAFAVTSTYFVPEWKIPMWPVYEAAMFGEVDAIAAAIPHEDLAIQWDAVEPGMLENPELMALATKEQLIAAIVRAVDRVPADVEVGLHLCYGDPGGKHVVEPKDLSAPVEFANKVSSQARHPLAWCHMPIPIERADDAYFAPLAHLKLKPGTELDLGLIHPADGLDGASRRVAAARHFVQEFGISTECGLGRRPPNVIPDLLTLHADVARQL